MIIGVSGQICTGKSSVAEYYKSKGYYHFDADKVYHELLENNIDIKKELISCFNTSKRSELKTIILKDSSKINILNEITHKYVYKEMKDVIKNNKNVILNIPIPNKTNFEDICDYIIICICNEKIQIERIINRDNCTKNEALKKIQLQKKQTSYIDMGNHVIDTNNLSKSELLLLLDYIVLPTNI